MIAAKLKDHYSAGEAITTEFAGLMRSTFAYYRELNTLFQEKLPFSLHQSELIAFLNTEIKPRLFNHAFCDRIQDSLKSLRRAIVRLEDIRASRTEIPEFINHLALLSELAERVEALYQSHWEHYRYQNHIKEQELVELLLEVDRIGNDWDVYMHGFATARDLVGALSGQLLPEQMVVMRVAYQQDKPAQFAVESMMSLMDFLNSCYVFVCAVGGLDSESRPLSIKHVEVGEPVELELAVPEEIEGAYRRFLQYLFLKDLLQREALLKFVMEAIVREYRAKEAGALANQSAFQKELSARLKKLPSEGRFTISNRTFPDDSVEVLHEFFVSLEEKEIPHEGLLLRGETARRGGKRRKAVAMRPEKPRTQQEPLPTNSPKPAQGDGPAGTEHIRILTEKGLSGTVPKQ
ncbi:MAG: hypothetical protein IID61_02580 [SAR324 cluster bacterium]|nr:hypothetical protein [SAR324 cluster bacterium]